MRPKIRLKMLSDALLYAGLLGLAICLPLNLIFDIESYIIKILSVVSGLISIYAAVAVALKKISAREDLESAEDEKIKKIFE